MTSSTAVRTSADQAPEYYHYEDTGCEVSPSCLTCPLPQCKYDDPAWFQRHRRLARDLNVWNIMQSERLTADEAAQRFSVTVRTIFRITSRCRDVMMEVDGGELLALSAD